MHLHWCAFALPAPWSSLCARSASPLPTTHTHTTYRRTLRLWTYPGRTLACRRAVRSPVTCGVCEGKCKDTMDDCPGWAKSGECETNPGHSLINCPLSCGTCAAGPCKDVNITACALWALAGQCKETPEYMAKECPASCGICTVVCEDKHKDCPSWTAAGECDSKKHMHKKCPQSCGVCSRLEQFARSQPALAAGSPVGGRSAPDTWLPMTTTAPVASSSHGDGKLQPIGTAAGSSQSSDIGLRAGRDLNEGEIVDALRDEPQAMRTSTYILDGSILSWTEAPQVPHLRRHL